MLTSLQNKSIGTNETIIDGLHNVKNSRNLSGGKSWIYSAPPLSGHITFRPSRSTYKSKKLCVLLCVMYDYDWTMGPMGQFGI